MRPKSGLVVTLVSTLVAANAWAAMSKEAQEFMAIQSRMAPDQCELQRLNSQAATAQRSGDLDKRQQLNAQMEPVVKRLQANQPRIQELSRYIQPSSPDYAAVRQQTMALRAKCKL